jgi:hypothetical protein
VSEKDLQEDIWLPNPGVPHSPRNALTPTLTPTPSVLRVLACNVTPSSVT